MSSPILRDALFLACVETAYLLRRRETLVWTFVMPVIFFYFIGTISSTNSGSGPSRDEVGVFAAKDGGFLADQLMARIEARGYRRLRPPAPDPSRLHRAGRYHCS